MKSKRTLRFGKRTLALLVTVAMLFTTFAQSFVVSAASTTLPEENLLKNATFEPSEPDLANGSVPGNWRSFFGAVKVTDVAHTGVGSVKLPSMNTSLEQTVTGLQNGVTYVYSIWAKADSLTDSTLRVGVKNHGSSESNVKIDSTDWKQYSIEFTTSNNSVLCYAWVEANAADNNFYVDDATLTVKSDLKQVSVQNGSITAEFKDTFTGTPSADNFQVTYSSSLNSSEVLPLTITGSDLTDKTLTMNFSEIAKQPVAQTITVYIKYVPNNQSITLDFPMEGSGGDVITAKIASLTGTNGTLTATLDKTPTVSPVVGDFSISYKIGDGEYKAISASDFVYNKADRTVTLNYNRLPVSLDEQTVTIKVTYQGEDSTTTFVIDANNGQTYYVSSTGSDTNDGLSPETPFKTIDKLNTITFMPGDQILFKKGEVFQGAFKPQGSGIEGAPIVVKSYGDADAAKPVLKQGTTNWSGKVMTADTRENNVTVNNAITFYNQEYWEVRDLELSGNQPNSYPGSIYNRGINITGFDAGELDHFYFDNLTIHGFRGPNSNLGKSSGGILMEVQSKYGDLASAHIPTSINDIRITNCELYDLGRSGVNFVSVWGRRAETNDTKWGPYSTNHGTNWPNYTRTPYNDFYLANNYIHDIDGDGLIADTCDDAIVEHNMVYNCEKNAPMAVGLFNWNSDNTIFQFNEVYKTHRGGDAQGIEIDALNDTTYVQYNYLHENQGGSIMWCNTPGLYGFDGVFRYNIFQNDNMEHGLLDWRPGTFGAQCYNNTFYMKTDGYKNFINGDGTSSEIEFYNNIFYWPGSTPFRANAFHEEKIDWKSNLFYNFENVPSGDSRSIIGDPLFVDPGKGGTGTNKPIDFNTLSGYKLQAGSPAIDAGVPIANNGGRDFFNNPVEGVPDIGAYDSGTIGLNIASLAYPVNNKNMTIAVADSGDLTASGLLNSIVTDKGVTAKILRGTTELTGATEVTNGDIIKVTKAAKSGEEAIYTIKITHDESLLVITSTAYTVNQNVKTIALTDITGITVDTLLSNITYNDGVTVQVYRGTTLLTGDDTIQIGDRVQASKSVYKDLYYITVAENPASTAKDIPTSYLTATAGSWESSGGSAEGPASNVLDGNISTIWHSKWASDAPENLWITLKISDDHPYVVDGVRNLPRSGGGANGTILKYRIQYSTDGTTFKDIPGATGTWERTEWQIAQFPPVAAKAIRIYAVESVSQEAPKRFASAAEMRLTGVAATGSDTTAPEAPAELSVDAATITQTGATIQWAVPADADVAGYKVYVNDGTNETIKYVANAKVNFLPLTGLAENTSYTVKVSAVDTSGNESAVATAAFKTKALIDEEAPTVPANLAAASVFEKKATITWTASTDNVGVTGYQVLVNGKYVTTVTEPTVTLADLTGGTKYTVSVKAIDEAGNQSAENSIVFTTVNKSTLKLVVDLAQGHVDAGETDDLIPSAKAQFDKAFNASKALYANEEATQEQVDKSWKTLMLVIQALDFKPGDKTQLITLVATATTIEGELDRYLDGAEKDAFVAALKAARDTIADEDAMKADVDDAYAKLDTAIKALELIPVDKDDLTALVGESETIYNNLNLYPDGALKNAFVNAYLKAQTVLADTNATQDDVDNAYAELDAAKKALLAAASLNKDELKKVIDEAKSRDLNKYVDANKDAFLAALANAEDVYTNSDSQSAVDAAHLALLNAMAALRLRADKSELEDWLDTLKNIDLSGYTAESVAAFRAAIANAEDLMSQDLDEFQQQEINATIIELLLAHGNLQPSANTEDPDSSNTSSGSSNASGNTSSDNKPSTGKPTTGDSTPIVALSLLAVAAAGAMLILKKKNSSEK